MECYLTCRTSDRSARSRRAFSTASTSNKTGLRPARRQGIQPLLCHAWIVAGVTFNNWANSRAFTNLVISNSLQERKTFTEGSLSAAGVGNRGRKGGQWWASKNAVVFTACARQRNYLCPVLLFCKSPENLASFSMAASLAEFSIRKTISLGLEQCLHHVVFGF